MTNIKISDFSQEAASKAKGLELRSQMEPLLKSGTPFLLILMVLHVLHLLFLIIALQAWH